MITCTSTSPLSGADQAVTDDVHNLRFCSCTTRNGAEERGLSAHVVFRRRKKERGLSAHCSRFFFSSPCTPTVTAWCRQQPNTSADSSLCICRHKTRRKIFGPQTASHLTHLLTANHLMHLHMAAQGICKCVCNMAA